MAAIESKEKMLINATQNEEIRVALIKDNVLYDLDIECPNEIKKKGNIYKGVVTRREPSLDAVFVEYGAKKQGFLPLKEISPEYFTQPLNEENPQPVNQLIREGQELLIQIDKEERGTKGAALTTFITLAGCYLVLMPNSPHAGGISRRIEGEERDEMKESLNELNVSEDMGLIIRTAGVGKRTDELQHDLEMLLKQWQAIQTAYQSQVAPCLIHLEGDVIIRSIRDNLRKSINEIIIDDHVSYVKARQFIELVKPEFLSHVRLYKSHVPLFNFYQIESQIETAFRRHVLLPSGGSLVIDRTEALVAIDINSAKSTSGQDIETTALHTNLEAADEIARQLRLRDLGGLVVIDFIDMSSQKHQRDVENRLKEALKADRARIQVGRISRFGLLEMSRQRLRLSLGETSQDVCPRCDGRGTVRNIPSHALSIIRLIEEEALKDKTAEIHAQLPVDLASYIINEKRAMVQQIEERHHIKIVIIPNPYIVAPHYQIQRVKHDQQNKPKKASFELIAQPAVEAPTGVAEVALERPAVDLLLSDHSNKIHEVNFLQRIFQKWFGPAQAAEKPTRTQHTKRPQQQGGQQSRDKKHHASSHHHSQNRRRRNNNNSHGNNMNRGQNQGQQQQQHKKPAKSKPQHSSQEEI
jgi:ribonuclease E